MRIVAVLLAGVLTGAVSASAARHPASGGPPILHPASGGPPVAQAEELPEGDGKKILQASCTSCHDLTEVTKFKGYFTRDDWRDIVKTMIAYGAEVKGPDVDVLVDYLAKTLGKQP